MDAETDPVRLQRLQHLCRRRRRSVEVNSIRFLLDNGAPLDVIGDPAGAHGPSV